VGLLDGKVAFVTGAARGQGRSHAIRLAQEGADIIALDACATPDWLSYPLATEADLRQTVKEVEALDRRIIARKADIRDLAAVRSVLDAGSSPGRKTPGTSTWTSSVSSST
jgi:(+)-trans-carveol dehydrogenase